MSDYCNSFAQYWDYIKAHDLPIGDMLKLAGDGNTLFTQWSVLHIFLYFIVALVWAILAIISTGPIVEVLVAFGIGLAIAYLLSHLGWFIIVVNNGCCSPVVNAILGIIFILWGIQYVSYGITGRSVIASPHLYSHEGEMSQAINLVRIVLWILYGVTLVYMGIAAIMTCNGGSFRGADDLEVAGGQEAGGTGKQAAPATNAHEVHVHVHLHGGGGDDIFSPQKMGKAIDTHVSEHGGKTSVKHVESSIRAKPQSNGEANGQGDVTPGRGGDTTPGRA